MGKRIVAIVGSYRKGGTTDSAIEAILEGAREKGAETKTIYLTCQHLEFSTNCHECTQIPDPERVSCVQQHDLESILMQIDAADAVVLGSSVNYGGLTAIFRRFLERVIGLSYWPWGQASPKPRKSQRTLKAALVASSAMPGFFIPLLTGAASTLRLAAKVLGAKLVGSLWIGLSAMEQNHPLSARTRERARRIGWKLA